MLWITSMREGGQFKNQGEAQSLLPGPHPPYLQISAVVTYMILRQDPTVQSAWPWDPSKYLDCRCVCAQPLSSSLLPLTTLSVVVEMCSNSPASVTSTKVQACVTLVSLFLLS